MLCPPMYSTEIHTALWPLMYYLWFEFKRALLEDHPLYAGKFRHVTRLQYIVRFTSACNQGLHHLKVCQ
ncbi:hypothetical protein Nepgr_026755 [Nepenthes gracilis]|uniref:Uncharacterized protein n=1 Tax=Nepenthes gracilis TaxID=150966 RepID=A0AAD3Y0N9_NEPGR|nr:hypothetical protein Nepgr_026755 [Nepenthes gracilis]